MVLSGLLLPWSMLAAENEDLLKKDLEKFQGDWIMVAGERNGQKMDAKLVRTFSRTVIGTKYTVSFEVPEAAVVQPGSFTLDPSKQPKAIDLVADDGPNKGKKMLGIYAFDGDTYKMCVAQPEKERPTAFATKEGSEWSLTVWKREKK